MRRYLTLWAELFRMSWQRLPGLTAASLASVVGSVLVVGATGLTLRAAVNATITGQRATALAMAVAAALACALSVVIAQLCDNLVGTTVDRIARLGLHPRVHEDISRVEGVEHLERSDYLDRVTVVRASTGRLVGGMWNAIIMVAAVLKIVVTLLLLGTVSPWLMLLLPLAAVPVWCEQRGQASVKLMEIETAEEYRLQQHLFELAVHAGSGKELRVTGAAPAIVRKQAEAWDSVIGRRTRARAVGAAWKLGGWLVFVTGFVGGLAVVTYRTAHGHGTIGDLVLTVALAATLRQTVQGAVSSTADTAGAGRVIDPYLWLREYLAKQRERSSGHVAPPEVLRDGIVLDNLTYRYPGTDRLALDDVSVRIPAGSVVAVVGEYGSGKTTLVKLLCKFYRPDSGRILVDGVDLDELNSESWLSRSSAAFQDFGRYRVRFAEAVGLGDSRFIADRERVLDAVEAADAGELVARLPQGLDTQLGRELGGVDLSEGQWQRTALARAVMRPEPLLFVLDEPTASLDAPSEQSIFERQMARARELADRTGAITVIVSHRFSTVTGADQILVLDQGRLVECGSHDELMALSGQYAELYGIQATAYRATQLEAT
ncbi:ABC transporter ATP-binding protein [Kitasatospora aureofaciens]|uniref:ABC transporter ATP-binding protein n=1 Tax=Kitasatospora aureofaciens TaxID=1894 RepID=UPI0037C66F7E